MRPSHVVTILSKPPVHCYATQRALKTQRTLPAPFNLLCHRLHSPIQRPHTRQKPCLRPNQRPNLIPLPLKRSLTPLTHSFPVLPTNHVISTPTLSLSFLLKHSLLTPSMSLPTPSLSPSPPPTSPLTCAPSSQARPPRPHGRRESANSASLNTSPRPTARCSLFCTLSPPIRSRSRRDRNL